MKFHFYFFVLLYPALLFAAERQQKLFQTLDQDQNGELQWAEFREFPGADRLKQFDKLDGNKDGRLSWEEFAGKKPPEPPEPPPIEKEFRILDQDRDGAITSEEWRTSAAAGIIVPTGGEKKVPSVFSMESGYPDGMIKRGEYLEARQGGRVGFETFPPTAVKREIEDARKELENPLKKYFQITGSDYNDSEELRGGPATFNWVRPKDGSASYRIDGAIRFRSGDLGRAGWFTPRLEISTEAHIIDFAGDDETAKEKEEARNQLRYKVGLRLDGKGWLFFAPEQQKKLRQTFLINGVYETDPANHVRNVNAELQWRPRFSPIGMGADLRLATLFAKTQEERDDGPEYPRFYWQPTLQIAYGQFEKLTITDSFAPIPTQPGAFQAVHTEVVTDDDTSRFTIDLRATLALTRRLRINGEYREVFELAEEHRSLAFGKVGIEFLLLEWEGFEVSLNAEYQKGKDSPKFQQVDIFTSGVGVKF